MRGEDHPLGREPLTETFRMEWSDLPRWARPPLHERIQAFIDEVNPETAAARGPWRPDLRARTRGDAGDYWAGRITDFTVTVDNDLETRDDLADAARMYLAGHVEPENWGMPERREDGRPVGYDEMVDRLNARREDRPVRDQSDLEEFDWEQAAEDLKRNGPDDLPDEAYIHPSVFPGEARTLAEAEALVGMHPKHETLEELPGPCILCGADEVNVSVRRNVDGEIEETELTCRECDWRATGGPADHLEVDVSGEDQIPRYCPFCGEDLVRVTVTFEGGEVQETQLQCSSCEPGQQ
jgi:hypothetical protein